MLYIDGNKLITIKLCASVKNNSLFHRVEDHDDLVPIFNRQSDMLKNTYGDYFLAELIEAQNDSMKCIVAEVQSHFIIMLLSAKVNHFHCLLTKYNIYQYITTIINQKRLCCINVCCKCTQKYELLIPPPEINFVYCFNCVLVSLHLIRWRKANQIYHLGSVHLKSVGGGRKTGAKPARNSCDPPPKSSTEFA